MTNINRIFTVIDLEKSTSVTDIRLPTTDTVEVVDVTTRAVLNIKAAAVSMYRHTLLWQGKSYNIMNIQQCV